MMTSCQRIIVTGVAGFLGSHLLDRLLNDGHQVIGIDNLSMGKLDNVRVHLDNPRFKFLQCDVTESETFDQITESIDCIVHLAAYKIPRYGNTLATLTTNSRGWERVLEFARRGGAKCVLASTSDVYGRNPKLPFAEDDDSVIGSSKVARWSYAVSKLFDEHLGFAHQEAYGIPFTALRFFGSYGPRHHLSWWGGPQSVFIDAILNDREITIHGDGLQTRSFTYVTDTVNGIYAAIMKPESNGEVLNIGSTHEITILDLARRIHQIAGTTRPLKTVFVPYESFTGGKYEDVRRRVPDVTRSERILGVRAEVTIEEGLAKTIEWQRRTTMAIQPEVETAPALAAVVRP